MCKSLRESIINRSVLLLFLGVASHVDLEQDGEKIKVCVEDSNYTRLSLFKSWVESKIGADNYCV